MFVRKKRELWRDFTMGEDDVAGSEGVVDANSLAVVISIPVAVPHVAPDYYTVKVLTSDGRVGWIRTFEDWVDRP